MMADNTVELSLFFRLVWCECRCLPELLWLWSLGAKYFDIDVKLVKLFKACEVEEGEDKLTLETGIDGKNLVVLNYSLKFSELCMNETRWWERAQSWGTAGAAQAHFVRGSSLLMSVWFIKNPAMYIISLKI